MIETPIHREYVRTDNWSVVAKIHKDKDADTEEWTEVKVPDLAAGGLLFLTDLTFEKGDELWFDLEIDPMTPGIYGKIRMKAKGEIRGDRGIRDEKHAYSVEFLEISETDKIRLDELILLNTIKYKVDAETDIFDR